MAAFYFSVGPFRYRIESEIPEVAHTLELLYEDFPRCDETKWYDFHVRTIRRPFLQSFGRDPYRLLLDHVEPFLPFPRNQAGAMLEWGMNWCLWLNLHHWLIFHAAMLERNGRGLILAAESGDGKSTLAAALAFRGWRLLSDELTILDPDDVVRLTPNGPPVARMVPIPRPVCLKNESIRVVKEFLPEAVFSPEYPDTGKGRIAHVKPPRAAVERMGERVIPRWIVFPKYTPGAPPTWTPWEKAEALLQWGGHGRGYSVLGKKGFECVANVIHHSDCWKFEYSNLSDAVEEMSQLANSSF